MSAVPVEFDCWILSAVLPQRPRFTLGVIVLDRKANRGKIRVRHDLKELADPLDVEVLEGQAQEFLAMAGDIGWTAMVTSLMDSLSNVVRISESFVVEAASAAEAMELAYSAQVQQGKSHSA